MSSNCSGASVVGLLTCQRQVSSLILERGCTSLSVSFVPAHIIKFYSFIFHSSEVFSGSSVIAPLDRVQLTAL